MKELIYREDAIDRVRHAWSKGLEPSQYIENVPAVDAVEVVRCRECRFNTTEKKCLNSDSIIKIPSDNDFCSYGQRREDGDT